MLYLRTLGGCHLERDGVRVSEVSAQRKALALLALLARAGTHGTTRDSAAALLWSESDDGRARASLKQLVHSLRMQLDVADAVLTTGDLRLNPDLIASDVTDFAQAVARGDLEVAAGLYGGPFLDGFHLRGAAEFERWVSEQRAVLAHAFAEAARNLAEEASSRSDHVAAAAWWRRLVDSDRLSARATLGLMHALDAIGERAAALRHAAVYERLVREEIGTEPDAAVVTLVKELRRAPAAHAPSPRQPAASHAWELRAPRARRASLCEHEP